MDIDGIQDVCKWTIQILLNLISFCDNIQTVILTISKEELPVTETHIKLIQRTTLQTKRLKLTGLILFKFLKRRTGS